jgi:hypothetical protein
VAPQTARSPALGINSQQTVYMTTQELAGRQLIRAAKEGSAWVFYALDAQADGVEVRASTASTTYAGALTPATFEALARRVLGEWYGTELSPGALAGIRKRFDSGSYHVGLQQGEIDGRIEGEGRVGFSFAGMDEMDEVHGRGELRVEGVQAHFVLEYHQGDTFTFICERPT